MEAAASGGEPVGVPTSRVPVAYRLVMPLHLPLVCLWCIPLQVRLQQNYRSSRCIVEAAAALIRNNDASGRAPKSAFTSNQDGEKISFPQP